MKYNIIAASKNIYLIGIGGTGMSGLAGLLLSSGKNVFGSDKNPSTILSELEAKGARIHYSQASKNIKRSMDVVIYSHAIFPDNPEYRKAEEYKIPMLAYPEAVGLIMEGKRGIAVAGTHGKTTTSSMVVSVLISAGCSPSFLLGGEILNLGNSGVGKGDFLVVEACEYRRSFLNYAPEIAIVTNIEKDHLDYYSDIREIKGAFGKFLCNVRENGKIIYCADDINALHVAEKTEKRKKVSYGLESGDWRAVDIKFFKDFMQYECHYKGRKIDEIKLRARGYHNVLNSLAAISCAGCLDMPFKPVKEALENFQGVHRRCEMLGEVDGITVIDDYGHHPTEITFTLETVKGMFPDSRLIVVFQPHQYSRTRIFLKDFAKAFVLADKIVVPEIYFVRDSINEKKLVNAQILVEKIRANGREALYLPAFEEIVEYLKEIVRKGDVILTIGAGPVDKVARGLLNKLGQ
ncbi:MAG TPA: UDP-N-acetylmuramate--L-alanine ligase [bacterium]|nr:UDP-N-acetylmuramate--L-alanine ligase [bacterium]